MLSSELFSVLEEHISNSKFLFEIRGDRYALVHDSLNNYINAQLQSIPSTINKDIENYVVSDVENGGLRFLSRLHLLPISVDKTLEIVKCFSTLNSFENLLSKTLDVEGLNEFYDNAKVFLGTLDHDIFTPNEYYEFACILNTVKRVYSNMTALPSLGYQLYEYCRQFCPERIQQVFSSKDMYHLFRSLDKNDTRIYHDYCKDNHQSVDNIFNSVMESRHFFDKINRKPNYEIVSSREYKDRDWRLGKEDEFVDCLVLSYINKNDFEGCIVMINDYADGKRMRAINVMSILIAPWKFNINVSPKYILEKIVEILWQLGILHNNPYRELTLREFIKKHAPKGSFNVLWKVEAFLRLAWHDKREIDILSINDYAVMYYNRKDITVSEIYKTFYILVNKKKVELFDALSFLHAAREMSEKGIKDLREEFFNLLDAKQLAEAYEHPLFEDFGLMLWWLKPDTLNRMPEEMAKELILIYLKPPYMRGYSVNYSDIKNALDSKYKDFTLEEICRRKLEFKNVPKDFSLGKYESTICAHFVSVKDEAEEKDKGSCIDRGWLQFSDKEWIKKKGIPLEVVARMGDGWYHKIPYPKIFEVYGKEEVRRRVAEILHNAMFRAKRRWGYDNYDDFLMGNIPELFDMYEVDVDWKKIRENLLKFLDLSSIHNL